VFRAFISADFGRFPLVDAFSDALRATEGQLKLVDLDLLHTTLKFLGDTEEALVPGIVAVMEEALRGIPPPMVVLRGTGAFPSPRRINVVWIGLEGAQPLAVIAAKLDRELARLGFRPEGRAWQPHTTVARAKGDRNIDRVRAVIEAHADEEFGAAPVDRIRLRRSVLTPQGPQYAIVAEVPFSASSPSSPDTA
jgi:2'-5' RNA ligase